MTSLLLLEDNESLGTALAQRLKQEGYEIIWTRSIEEARRSITQRIDLAIVDVGLPDGSGFDFARSALAPASIPFVFLTAMNTVEDRLEGYELGGEDYIPKPFHLREFLLRIRRVLDAKKSEGRIACDGFALNLSALSIEFPDGRAEYPQTRDFQLLRLLAEASPAVLSREEIIKKLWSDEPRSNFRSIDNAVMRLRQLLGEKHADRIRSVRGVGYQFIKNS